MPETLVTDPPRATSFIVTVYGDVVLPRGGALWMGSLIDTCAAQGISESLVRTAVSRLVAAGQLEGERIGRRSYYRLSDAAAEEYARAGRLFYAHPPRADGWCIALGLLPETLPQPWVRLGVEVALAPDRSGLSLPGAVLVRGAGEGDPAGFGHRHFPLAETGAAYARVTALCGGMSAVPQDGAMALALRLRLIHLYRLAVLRDPGLPAEALGPDWPGTEARRLFVTRYRALGAAAEAHVAVALRNSHGPLPARTDETRRRDALLQAEDAAQGADPAPDS